MKCVENVLGQPILTFYLSRPTHFATSVNITAGGSVHSYVLMNNKQERMLKKGLVWHYGAYDKRPELEKVISPLLFLLFDC